MSTTLSSYGVALSRTLDDYGLDSAELFRGAGLEPEVMKNPNARYPDERLVRLLTAAVTASGDEAFGLRLARFMAPTTLHAL
ncbi:MAG: AraC family transcriptional regulator ligand-binding domain-containing protein, partial [Candidatus Competibacterales bacterium]|nr:AraC family transcriptional regulator ligand-binding domain-containing protein [Candidatus Competibacterales bacterium]